MKWHIKCRQYIIPHTQARTHARTHIHTHTHTHIHTHARTHVRTHARTHAHTHTKRLIWKIYWLASVWKWAFKNPHPGPECPLFSASEVCSPVPPFPDVVMATTDHSFVWPVVKTASGCPGRFSAWFTVHSSDTYIHTPQRDYTWSCGFHDQFWTVRSNCMKPFWVMFPAMRSSSLELGENSWGGKRDRKADNK